jgi:internalin A
LKYLVCDYCGLKDCAFLQRLPKLEQLTSIRGHELNDVTVQDIGKAISLEILKLSLANITNIRFLAHLPKLKELVLYNVGVSLELLGSLHNLRKLYVELADTCPPTDLIFLMPLVHLTTLGLQRCQIENIEPLEKLKNLTELYLAFNPLKDLTPLKNLPNLKRVYLDKDQIERLDAYTFFKAINPAIKVIQWPCYYLEELFSWL